ncbi:MAG TPA: ABC transporter ATP-binding protein [Anaerolineaceae bacterium]|nr:ABC transporter ATP-binding protein [Anaerolineaceae bacterium]
MEEIIRMEHIVKVYPPSVVALDDVSVSFRQGEIHAVVGENGAGKSTLMKVLYGLVARDDGEIFVRGQPAQFHEPGEAIAQGIGMVHQEIVLIPEYTVWENIILGAEPAGLFGTIDADRARRQVAEEIAEFQFNLDPDAQVGEISVAARQKVEILKLLYRNVSILILDEPTAVLTPQEIPQLFSELKKMRDNGKTILFVSHRLDEVMELSDRITVMRKGKKVDTVEANRTTKQDLARMMVGREVIFSSRRSQHLYGEVVCQIENLSYRDPEGRQRLKDVSINVRAGEIVGVAGVEGNGQYELVNSVVGLIQPQQGKVLVKGIDLTHLPILQRRELISFVPQDRGKMGASVNASILENAIMLHHRLNPALSAWKGLLLNFANARRFTTDLEKKFSVNMASSDDPFRSLSGGNQQKVILGRELLLNNPFVLLDQPTRGLDVGSIEYVHEQVLAMREAGRAILLISADLEELFMLSDRIVVLYRGEIAADLPVESTSVEDIGMRMLEGYPEAS